jgi:uncharacterized protein (TIGR03435 family)
VLTQEREHARRRDPLWRLVASLNRALFWFHPLAWWLERKLSGLAEEACDAAVLACGYDPRDYSEFLLDLARSVRRAGARVGALGVAMPGIGLECRIRKMLSGVRVPQVSRPRMAGAAALCIMAGAIFAMGTLVRAQSGSKGRLEFEVASVRPSDPRSGGGWGGLKGKGGGGLPIAIGHGRFDYSASLLGLIVQAYHIAGCRPIPTRDTCPLISGGPAWIDKDTFDIQAKTPEATPDYTWFQFTQGQALQIQVMLQSLLADRFNLKVHREKRQMPVYALVAVKNGRKIKKSVPMATKQTPDGDPIGIEGRAFLFQPSVQPNGERMIRLTVKNWPI